MPKKNRELVPTQGGLQGDKDYQNLLQELQSIISRGQYAAYKAVDNIKVQTYWQLGERIVREELKNKNRADYGKYLIENLAADLRISRPELYKIVKFYRSYEIVSTVSRQLSWGHYVELIGIEEEHKRLFYQNKAVLNSWGVRELREKIKSQLYESTSAPEIEATFRTKLPAVEPYEAFRNVYNFNFLGLKEFYKEKELEDKILLHITKFLQELGEDFCLAGRQAPIKIDGETHHIDLVLYHKGIPCNILVDLKIGKIDAGDIGQMNKYVSYWRRHRQYEHEKDTIGLIICREAGREEIMYALGGLERKIFVARYMDKLPSEAKIKKALREL
jgi:predicted nuclease of restriction endonuclease-like (RecB) superfamily